MTRADETGASAVEYGLIIAAIAAVIMVAAFSLGNVARDLYSSSTSCLQAQASSTC